MSANTIIRGWVALRAHKRKADGFLLHTGACEPGCKPPLFPPLVEEEKGDIVVGLAETREVKETRVSVMTLAKWLEEVLGYGRQMVASDATWLPGLLLTLVYAIGDPEHVHRRFPQLRVDPWRRVAGGYSAGMVELLRRLAFLVDIGDWVVMRDAAFTRVLAPPRPRPLRFVPSGELIPDKRCDTYDPRSRCCGCRNPCPHPLIPSIIVYALEHERGEVGCGADSPVTLCKYFEPLSDVFADIFPVADVWGDVVNMLPADGTLFVRCSYLDAYLTCASFAHRDRALSVSDLPPGTRGPCDFSEQMTRLIDAGESGTIRISATGVVVHDAGAEGLGMEYAAGGTLYACIVAPPPPEAGFLMPYHNILYRNYTSQGRSGVAWTLRTLAVLVNSYSHRDIPTKSWPNLLPKPTANMQFYTRMLPALVDAAQLPLRPACADLRKFVNGLIAIASFDATLAILPAGFRQLRHLTACAACTSAKTCGKFCLAACRTSHEHIALPRRMRWHADRGDQPTPAAIALALMALHKATPSKNTSRIIRTVVASIDFSPATSYAKATARAAGFGDVAEAVGTDVPENAMERLFWTVERAHRPVDWVRATDATPPLWRRHDGKFVAADEAMYIVRAAHPDPVADTPRVRRMGSPLYAADRDMIGIVYRKQVPASGLRDIVRAEADPIDPSP